MFGSTAQRIVAILFVSIYALVVGNLTLEIAQSGASSDIKIASSEVRCQVCREALMDVWQKASFGVLDTEVRIEDDITSHCSIKAWATQYTLSGEPGSYTIKNRSGEDYR